MQQHELDRVHRRDVFEDSLAEQLERVFPISADNLKDSLRSMREGETYVQRGDSYTGRTIAQMACVSWGCWRSALLVA